jgi:hypothetical protein
MSLYRSVIPISFSCQDAVNIGDRTYIVWGCAGVCRSNISASTLGKMQDRLMKTAMRWWALMIRIMEGWGVRITNLKQTVITEDIGVLPSASSGKFYNSREVRTAPFHDLSNSSNIKCSSEPYKSVDKYDKITRNRCIFKYCECLCAFFITANHTLLRPAQFGDSGDGWSHMQIKPFLKL